jgi:hypothetical protein
MKKSTLKSLSRVSNYSRRGVFALFFTLIPSVALSSSFPPLLPPVLSAFVFSTVPGNGDLNPYGVAFVPPGFPGGKLNPGDILVSNFNNSNNQQGMGTSILRVQLSPQPMFQQTSTFATTGRVKGLTAALGVIQEGFVFVGSVPTTDGTSNTVSAGPLLVLDSSGNVVDRITSPPLNGPWGLAINSRQANHVQVFVSNVLGGTVSRLDFSFPSAGTIHFDSITQIGSRYSHRTDPAAIVIGPAGLAYDQSLDTLFVAGEANDKIFAISNASTTTDQGTGKIVFADTSHLHGPMGLTLAPNGNLLVANNDSINPDPNQPSELVEFTTLGGFVRQFSIDPNIDGPFGIVAAEFSEVNDLAFVNDNNNTLSVWRFAE